MDFMVAAVNKFVPQVSKKKNFSQVIMRFTALNFFSIFISKWFTKNCFLFLFPLWTRLILVYNRVTVYEFQNVIHFMSQKKKYKKNEREKNK